ncbi:MAG: helix-turn-helix domain-containing protein [Acidobacteria bacterium]|nr:helix-turn-helix domain-containing protein [Acidobacteriota bacterium]
MTNAGNPPRPRLKERVEALCREMFENGILFSEAMEYFEVSFITEVLQRNGGNLKRAAADLGIHRNTLSKKVNRRNHSKS